MKSLVDVIRRSSSMSLLVCVSLVLGACSADDGTEPSDPAEDRSAGLSYDEAKNVCGWETLPSPARPAADPCSDGELLLEADFINSSGNVKSFELDAASRVCVLLDPSDDNGTSVQVDGVPVEQDGRQPEGGRYTLELEAGQHRVEVHGSGGQASGVKLLASAVRPGQDVVQGQNGILELTRVMVDHPMFSPNGDHYHDTVLFNADNFPRSLPGKESGQFDYFLDWQWEVVEADSCSSLGTVQAGRTQVNSPTNVQALWDGGDDESASSIGALGDSTTISAGAAVPDGKYLYRYTADLVRSDGLVIDSVTSRAHAMIVDSTSSRHPNRLGAASTASAGSLSDSNFIESCSPSTDPNNCQCPSASSLADGTRCTEATVADLVSFENPATVPTHSFIESSYNADTERWTVMVDLRQFNGGGLVPQTEGIWQSTDELQTYIEQLTGVPADPDEERLFNFDYVQLGYSTPVLAGDGAIDGFNHFLLDVITDQEGKLTIGTTTYDLHRIFAAGGNAIPAKYQIEKEREGDECYHNGNSDGLTEVEARSCTELRMVNLDPGTTGLGIYRIRTRFFNYLVDGQGTARENYCTSSGCTVRTIQRDAKMLEVGRSHYAEDVDGVSFAAEYDSEIAATPSLVIETDRGFFEGNDAEAFDGVCSRGNLLTYDNIEIPLDSADGALPGTCIINGII